MKMFNIGLNLDASLDDLDLFYSTYNHLISDVYFSLPLGKTFYTRRGLIKESEGNEAKLIDALGIIKQHGIRTEVALNTHLHQDEISKSIDYIYKNNIVPDEVVCINESFDVLKEAFPKAEFISSFNNGFSKVDSRFDSVVLGQRFLRDENARHDFINSGFNVVLLLNNGCSFECNPRFCDSSHCTFAYRASLNTHTFDEIYAIQSFFPEELTSLLEHDPFAQTYRLKISNRPLGLTYSEKALRAYSTPVFTSADEMEKDPSNYGLFGALHSLYMKINDYNYQAIMIAKQNMQPLSLTRK